jgi:parallel beta-helix repeat protein
VKITYSSSVAHHIRIKNSEVKNAPGQGILLSGNSSFPADYNEFINLDVHDNGRTRFDHGFYVTTSNNLVENCRIYRNRGWGVHVWNGSYPDGTANNNTIRNNKIYNNAIARDGGPGIILSCGSGNSAYNNLIWGNAGGIQIDYSSANSKVWNNTIFANNAAVDSGDDYGIYIGRRNANASTIVEKNGSSNAVIRNNIVYGNLGGDIDNAGSGTILTNNLTGNTNHQFRERHYTG